MRALLIGCGKMGGALLSKWIRLNDLSFTVVDPNLECAPDGVRYLRDASSLGSERFEIVIVAIKPQLIDTVLPAYRENMSNTGVLASIAAGCSVARLQAVMGQVPVIRIMPNLPAEIGKGVSGLFASPSAGPEHRKQVEALMTLSGTAIWVDSEDGLDRITAVAGSGPGYVFEIVRTYVAAAMALGFSELEAQKLVFGTIVGTVELAMGSDHSLTTLRNNVTSKGGTTHAGLLALNGDESLSNLMNAATQAAYERAVEMR